MLGSEQTSKTSGAEIHALAEQLFPICRSMTGDGVRETLSIIDQIVPVDVKEVASGQKAFDWHVPQEWNVIDAYVKDENGNRVIDFKESNLHLLNGSHPVNDTIDWQTLKTRLHTLPERPHAIPYRTAFHRETWGFCISQNMFDRLEKNGNAQYEVVINSEIKDGSLTYGEVFIPGKTSREVLFSAHVCHPSLANDNLSGIAVAAFLARALKRKTDLKYSYRVIFTPATIGAIIWLSRNQERLHQIRGGLVLSLLGDEGPLTYKQSRQGNSRIDRAAARVLRTSGKRQEIRSFAPFGYDERQFCSPGINLAMGCLTRTPHGEFAEYHTSDDNLDFIRPESLCGSLETLLAIVEQFENETVYQNKKPFCEPRLGQHGLYDSFPAGEESAQLQKAVLWVLNLSDGDHSLQDIAETSQLPLPLIEDAAGRLERCDLLELC